MNPIQSTTSRLRVFYDIVDVLPKQLYVNRVGILANLILFYLLWVDAQGQDLLISLNQSSVYVIIYYFVLMTILAALVWFLPRFLRKDTNHRTFREITKLENTSHYQHLDSVDGHISRVLPRVLGVGIIMNFACATLHVMDTMGHEGLLDHLGNWFTGHFIFGVFMFVSILLMVPRIYELIRERTMRFPRLLLAFTIILLLTQVLLGYYNEGSEDDLWMLFISNIILAILFGILVFYRKQIRAIHSTRAIGKIIIQLGRICGIPFVVANILFIYGLTDISGIALFHSLVILISALGFYTYLVYGLMMVGKKLRLPVLTGLLGVLFIIANLTGGKAHHEIRTVPYSGINETERPRLDVHFEQWLSARRDQILKYKKETGRNFPIVIVSSEGGGSRAALWTLMVHTAIHRMVPEYFNHHIYAFTNASGGGTGNSIYFHLARQNKTVDEMRDGSFNVFQNDFLSSSISLLLGVDNYQSTFGIHLFDDRARILENQWTEALKEYAEDEFGFDRPFLSYWNDGSDRVDPLLPLLFLNTTNVQSGSHAVTAPVYIDQSVFPNCMDLLRTIDQQTTKTICLSTAVLLNARFPLVNPVGNIPGTELQFGDAGYYDNFGAENAYNIIHELKKRKKDIKARHPDLKEVIENIEFVSLVIENSSVETSPPLSSVIQPLAPISTLVNIRSANTKHGIESLKSEADVFFHIKLDQVEFNSGVKPIIPLARMLSRQAAVAIQRCSNEQACNSNSEMRQFVRHILRREPSASRKDFMRLTGK